MKTDRDFIYELLAELRTIRDRGRPKTEDIAKLLDKVRDHLVDAKAAS